MAQRQASANDRWGEAGPYEQYVGRWSRLVATEFVLWLCTKPNSSWGEIGCGTGALTETVMRLGKPRSIHAFDKSEGFVGFAASQITDPRVRFEVADATALPMADSSCDAAVSGLVLNFVGRPASMVSEMARVTRLGGRVAAYVWNYADGMQMMRRFWDAAVRICGAAEVPDEASRFPVCAPEPLRSLWTEAGLTDVEIRAIEVPTRFSSFDDYWQPFLGGQGAAPTWLAGLSEEKRDAIRSSLYKELAVNPDGGISLIASAWAIKGSRA